MSTKLKEGALLRELVLLEEGLTDAKTFQALTGLTPLEAAKMIVDPKVFAAVSAMRRMMDADLIQMRAATMSRGALGVVEDILTDPDASHSTRLEAARTTLKAAGGDKPAEGPTGSAIPQFSIALLRPRNPSRGCTIEGVPQQPKRTAMRSHADEDLTDEERAAYAKLGAEGRGPVIDPEPPEVA